MVMKKKVWQWTKDAIQKGKGRNGRVELSLEDIKKGYVEVWLMTVIVVIIFMVIDETRYHHNCIRRIVATPSEMHIPNELYI